MAAEDYVGKPGFEKKLHKTHFEIVRVLKNRKHPKDDPEWEYVGVGRWRWKGKRKVEKNGKEEPREDSQSG